MTEPRERVNNGWWRLVDPDVEVVEINIVFALVCYVAADDSESWVGENADGRSAIDQDVIEIDVT